VGVVAWILFGLLAGLVARMVTPGTHRLGCITTVVVGIFGAFLGGLIGQVILGETIHFGFGLKPFVLAVVGAIVLLLALQALRKR
jgi:uncharacterized membrane protein YeaQ/YmgE (transglycosylase-associated protein family)